MDSFEFNKIAGAVLMALLIATVIGHAGEILVPEPAESHAIQIAGAAAGEGKGGAPVQEANAAGGEIKPIAAFLAKATVEAGMRIANQCKACHTFGKGEPTRIGPNLYGIVGEKIAARQGYPFSDALKKLSGEWDFEALNKWIDGPQKMAPGTKMTFAGVKDEQQRADVIAYLNSLSESPKPLPK